MAFSSSSINSSYLYLSAWHARETRSKWQTCIKKGLFEIPTEHSVTLRYSCDDRGWALGLPSVTGWAIGQPWVVSLTLDNESRSIHGIPQEVAGSKGIYVLNTDTDGTNASPHTPFMSVIYKAGEGDSQDEQNSGIASHMLYMQVLSFSRDAEAEALREFDPDYDIKCENEDIEDPMTTPMIIKRLLAVVSRQTRDIKQLQSYISSQSEKSEQKRINEEIEQMRIEDYLLM